MRKPAPQPSDADSQTLKNGWLGLAVIGSVLIMGALVLLNLRLLRDESPLGKSAIQSSCPPRGGSISPPSGPGSAVCENRVSGGPPQVTFYSKLMAPEEQSRTATDLAQPAPAEGQDSNPRQEAKSSENLKPPDRTEEAKRRKAMASQAKPSSSGPPNLIPPSNPGGARTYTVQVGAFSHPEIAQQWAMRWKARGYDVSLKPVARPSGVIYRLYLGNFSSESQADELVRHLKSKEGISALRLVVRN